MASTTSIITSASTPPAEAQVSEWPLLTFKDFTIFTIGNLKNGNNKGFQVPMKEKYSIHCADYEMVRPILNIMVHLPPLKQELCHQMVHTIILNLGSGNGNEHQEDFIEMATLSSHVTSAFAQIATAFRCKTPPSLSSPSIVTCLAASLRKAHNDLAEIARKEYEQNVAFNILRDLAAIKAKDDNGGALNAVEAAIRRMNGGKAGGDVNDESEGGRAHSIAELVREAARFTKLCVAEADKHAPEMADGEEAAVCGN